MLEKLRRIPEALNLSRFNPEIYSPKDAQKTLAKVSDTRYAFGDEPVGPELIRDRAKIWSITPATFLRIEDIVNDASHVHAIPLVMGTYNMNTRSLRMNDFCMTDPYFGYLAATGGLEGLAVPFLRALYFVGRQGWWRHESIHARHHHQMAEFLVAKKGDPRPPFSDVHSDTAAKTIHESGIEEILTRWQSLKEANGVREKTVSALALALYMEYAPFTGIRNAVTDAKEATVDNVDNTAIRRSIKLGIGVGSFLGPVALNEELHFVEGAAEVLDDSLPFSQDQIESAFFRGMAYVSVSVLGALLSSKEKGEHQTHQNGRIPTTEYKFPYTYNPVSATLRSLDLLRYINRVWDGIPNFRKVRSRRGIDGVKREIDDRISGRFSDRDQAFTMEIVEQALTPLEALKRSSFPKDIYVRGMFTPALYLGLRDRYHPAVKSDSPVEHEVYSAS